MQKIIFVITKSNWGGAQRYVFDVASSLPKAEWHTLVAMGGTGLPGAPTGRLEEELRHHDIRTVFVASFIRNLSFFREWRVLRELWDIFAKEQPDIVHLNSSKAGGLGALAARLAGVPHIIFTLHGAPWQEDRHFLGRAAILFSSWLTFMLSHRIIALSQSEYERVRAMPLCKRRTRLIHNGLPPLQFAPKEEALKTLGLSAGAPIIGSVGELVWNKGYHMLIRAASILKRRGYDFTLCLVGDGEERKFLETLATDEDIADHVHFAGFVPDARRLLKAFDIYALSSVKEGLPYVVLEAGQAGLAVAATRVGGVPDVVIDRFTGLLCPPKDAAALADILEELLRDSALRQTLGSDLAQRVQKEFSQEHMLARTIAVYRQQQGS